MHLGVALAHRYRDQNEGDIGIGPVKEDLIKTQKKQEPYLQVI